MADIRINALATTAASTASDDFLAVDGSANGTRKLNAYSPTFGGNLTVSGAATLAGNLTVSGGTTTLADSNGSFGTITGSYNAGNPFVRFNRIGATESVGFYADKSTRFVNNNAETARFFANGNLFVGASPVDGGQKLQVSGTAYVSGNATFAGTVTPTGGIVGVTTNSNAAAGIVGEYVSSTVASSSAVSLTTATAANVTSISLTAGDWDVEANIFFTQQAGTTSTYLIAGLNSTSATIPSNNDGGRYNLLGFSGDAADATSKPSRRYSLSATTTIYVVAQAGFSGGTCSAFGQLFARRVR